VLVLVVLLLFSSMNQAKNGTAIKVCLRCTNNCGSHAEHTETMTRVWGGVAGAFGRFFLNRQMDRGSNMFDIRCQYE
jgi:hypothetical protein